MYYCFYKTILNLTTYRATAAASTITSDVAQNRHHNTQIGSYREEAVRRDWMFRYHYVMLRGQKPLVNVTVWGYVFVFVFDDGVDDDESTKL